MHHIPVNGPAACATDRGDAAQDRDQPETGDVTYVVTYALMIDSKDDGIHMRDVCFGGVGNDLEEARKVAKDCVNKMKGGVILPKIIPVTDRPRVLNAMVEATKHFTNMELQMIEAEEILASTDRRRRRH